MAFQAIKPKKQAGVRVGNKDSVTVAYHTRDGKAGRIQIRIGYNLMEEMGAKIGETALVELGEGVDKGYVRISMMSNGNYRLRKTSTGTESAGSITFLNENCDHLKSSKSAELVTFQRFGSSLTVLMPDWYLENCCGN
jgi:hypothetical protein